MSAFKTQSFINFGSLNEDVNPQALGQNELVQADNCWQNGNRFGTRPGVQFEAAVATGIYSAQLAGAVQGGAEFLNRNETGGEMIVIANGNVYTDSSTILTKTGAVITAGADNRWTFAEFANSIYFAGGTSSDTVCKWTGSGAVTNVTFQLSDEATTVTSQQFIYQKWNYGFIAGMDGTTFEGCGHAATDRITRRPVIHVVQLGIPDRNPSLHRWSRSL